MKQVRKKQVELMFTHRAIKVCHDPIRKDKWLKVYSVYLLMSIVRHFLILICSCSGPHSPIHKPKTILECSPFFVN